jgi:hypothetical protein
VPRIDDNAGQRRSSAFQDHVLRVNEITSGFSASVTGEDAVGGMSA